MHNFRDDVDLPHNSYSIVNLREREGKEVNREKMVIKCRR